MDQNVHSFVSSPKFKKLVSMRWAFSFVMLGILFVMYYGYVFLAAVDKDLMAVRVSPHVTLGIVLGIGVIVAAWLLTVIYVIWANNYYDKLVNELKNELQ